MEQVTHKKYYQVHSWVGVITGILLFVIAFTGAVSVFGRPELKVWANEPLRSEFSVDWEAFEATANQHAETVGDAYLEEVFLWPANRFNQQDHTFIYEGHFETEAGGEEHRIKWFTHDPQSMELVSSGDGTFEDLNATRSTDMADYIIGFHADLHLGRPIGLLITGLLGLTLMASIVTGIVIHKKILREFFTFRPFRSLRLMWQDAHKAISVWGMLFHFAIAFSGAFLGLATVILVPAAAFVTFEGDQEALVETFVAINEPERSGIAAPMRVGEVMRLAKTNPEADAVYTGTILGWGDQNAVMYVNGTGKETMGNMLFVYQPADASFVESFANFGRLGGVTGPVLDVMFPLHFGNFGGLFVKVIWAVLGLGTATVAITGMMLWIERRAYGSEGTLSMRSYKRLSRLTIGTCGGVVLACVALFPAQLLMTVPGPERFFWFNIAFLGIWALVTAYALVRDNEYRTVKEMFGLAGVGLIGSAVLNWLVTGDHPLNALTDGHISTSVVDLVLIAFGLLCFREAKRLPLERRERKGVSSETDSDFGDAESVAAE